MSVQKHLLAKPETECGILNLPYIIDSLHLAGIFLNTNEEMLILCLTPLDLHELVKF